MTVLMFPSTGYFQLLCTWNICSWLLGDKAPTPTLAFSSSHFSNPQLFILVSLRALFTLQPFGPPLSGALASALTRLNNFAACQVVVINWTKEWWWWWFFFFFVRLFLKCFRFYSSVIKDIFSVLFFCPNLFITFAYTVCQSKQSPSLLESLIYQTDC